MQSFSQIITINKPTPSFLQAGSPSCHPTNGVTAQKENIKSPPGMEGMADLLKQTPSPCVTMPKLVVLRWGVFGLCLLEMGGVADP